MSEFTLYTNPQSRGIHVLWMLEECEADYKVIPMAFGKVMKADNYTSINPMGKVPALKHNDIIMTETAAILLYLAEQFPEKKLIPEAGTAARGELYRLMFLTLHCEYAILDKFLGVAETLERSKSVGYGDFLTITKTLRDVIEDKNFLIGDSFSVLDLFVSGLLGWAMNNVSVLPTDDTVFGSYLAKHGARKGFGITMEKTKQLATEI